MAGKDDFGRGRRPPTPLSGQRREVPRSMNSAGGAADSAGGTAPLGRSKEPVRAVRLDEAAAALVQEVLEGRRPLTALIQHAGDRRKALCLWAEAMGTMYPNGTVEGTCSFCAKQPATEMREYAWRKVLSRNLLENTLRLIVFVPLMIVLGHWLNMARFQRLDLPTDEVAFTTHHGCCKGCRTRLKMRQMTSGFLRMSLAVVAMIAGIVALLAGIGIVGAFAGGNQADRDGILMTGAVFGVAMLVVVLMIAGMRQVGKRLGLPAAVRPIMRGGFVQDLRKPENRPLG